MLPSVFGKERKSFAKGTGGPRTRRKEVRLLCLWTAHSRRVQRPRLEKLKSRFGSGIRGEEQESLLTERYGNLDLTKVHPCQEKSTLGAAPVYGGVGVLRDRHRMGGSRRMSVQATTTCLGLLVSFHAWSRRQPENHKSGTRGSPAPSAITQLRNQVSFDLKKSGGQADEKHGGPHCQSHWKEDETPVKNRKTFYGLWLRSVASQEQLTLKDRRAHVSN